MLSDLSVPILHGIDVNHIWFQQDGATCQTSHAAIDLLRPPFVGCLISRNYDGNWPARGCNLTLLDYFLLGAVKVKFYAYNLETIEHLKANIHEATAKIRPHALQE